MSADYDSDFVDRLLFGEKLCRTCRIAKPNSSEHFGRDAGNDDGLNLDCKPCRRERQQARYQSDPKYREAKAAAWKRRAAA